MKSDKKRKMKRRIGYDYEKRHIFMFLVFVFFMGIGYSIISTTLSVGGSINVKKYDRTLYNVLAKAGKLGVYAKKYTGNHQDSMAGVGDKAIYHWYADNDTDGTAITNMNNVIFAGQCWQMFRTTDTGGVKMIYNGEAENDQCLNTRGTHIGYNSLTSENLTSNYWYGTDYTYDSSTKTFKLSGTTERATWNSTTGPGLVGKYTCKSTYNVDATCSTLYLVDSYKNQALANVIKINSSSDYSQFGKLDYKTTAHTNSSDLGYMYGDVYYSGTDPLLSERQFTTMSQTLLSTQSLRTSYWNADTIDYGNLTANKYTLINPYRVSSSSDYPNLEGKYSLLGMASNAYSSVYYIVKVNGSTAYYTELNGGNLLSAYDPIVFGDSISDNLDGTYTIDNRVSVSLSSWYTDYNNYKNKYTCGDSSTTCTNPRYVTATTRYKYTYLDAGEKIMIGKTRSGVTLTDTRLVRSDEWYNNYNNYSDYKYTCNTDNATCTESTLRMITNIDKSYYRYVPNRYYGSSVTWDGTNYTLVNTIGVENYNNRNNISTHHYTCDDGLKTCQTVKYIYYLITGNNTTGNEDHIILRDGVPSISQALSNMFTKNTTNSAIKNGVDAWYKKYLLDYDAYIEDTIFCNDRSIQALNGWKADGGIPDQQSLNFKEYNNISSDLSCTNITDRFSTVNTSATLSYKVGLMTSPEANILNNGNARKTGQQYWLLSPSHYVGEVKFYSVNATGSMVVGSSSLGVRPVISLIPGIEYSRGNGRMDNPYIVSLNSE